MYLSWEVELFSFPKETPFLFVPSVLPFCKGVNLEYPNRIAPQKVGVLTFPWQ